MSNTKILYINAILGMIVVSLLFTSTLLSERALASSLPPALNVSESNTNTTTSGSTNTTNATRVIPENLAGTLGNATKVLENATAGLINATQALQNISAEPSLATPTLTNLSEIVSELARLTQQARTEQEPFLFVTKSISQTNFSWTDQVGIILTVTNAGDTAARSVALVDHIPSGFDATSQELSISNDVLSQNIAALERGESFTASYMIKGKQGTAGTMAITLQPAELRYSDEMGNIITKISNQLRVLVQSDENSYNTIGTAIALMVVTFAVGGFGAAIHRVNMSKTEETQLEGRKAGHYFLLGGVAGVVILATFEGLSQLFSNEQLRLTTQNLVVLIGTCFIAGFAPMDIIKNATEKWRKVAADANKEKNKAEEAKKAESTVAKDNEILFKDANSKNKELDRSLNEAKQLGSVSAEIIQKTEESNSQLLNENATLKESNSQLLNENATLKESKKNP